jgi:chromate transporter
MRDNGAMADPVDARPPPSLAAQAAVFARYANLTWGGGSATIAVLHAQIVARRHWLSELQFELAFALSRLTPGTNLLAFCTGAGWLTRRWLGALVALVASSLPCALIAVLVTHFYEVWQHDPIVLAALRGALAAAVAIMVYTAWHLAHSHVKAEPLRAVLVVGGAILLTRLVGWSPARVLLLAALVGLAWPAAPARVRAP